MSWIYEIIPQIQLGIVFHPHCKANNPGVDHCSCFNTLWILNSKQESNKKNAKIRPTPQQSPRHWLSHMVGHGHLQGFPRAKRNVKETRRCRGITSPRSQISRKLMNEIECYYVSLLFWGGTCNWQDIWIYIYMYKYKSLNQYIYIIYEYNIFQYPYCMFLYFKHFNEHVWWNRHQECTEVVFTIWSPWPPEVHRTRSTTITQIGMGDLTVTSNNSGSSRLGESSTFL